MEGLHVVFCDIHIAHIEGCNPFHKAAPAFT
jgi:hypothetical protein